MVLSVYWHITSAYHLHNDLGIRFARWKLHLETVDLSECYLSVALQRKDGGRAPEPEARSQSVCCRGLIRASAAVKHTQYFWLLANTLISQQVGSEAEQKPCDKEQPARTFYDPEFLNVTEVGVCVDTSVSWVLGCSLGVHKTPNYCDMEFLSSASLTVYNWNNLF